jgi:hypothetical protein
VGSINPFTANATSRSRRPPSNGGGTIL